LDVAGHIHHSLKVDSIGAYLDVEVSRVQTEVIASRSRVLQHKTADGEIAPEIRLKKRIGR
jgi:hypothetical protein